MAISGLAPITGGEILLDGQVISAHAGAPDHRARHHARFSRAASCSPIRRVEDNLLLGAYTRLRRHRGASARAHGPRDRTAFPILRERRRQLAGTLSGGEQQMLAISRGLMSQPKLLLMDEPSDGAGAAARPADRPHHPPAPRRGATILLVEQMASVALALADRAYVLENGAGHPEPGRSWDLAQNPEVSARTSGE